MKSKAFIEEEKGYNFEKTEPLVEQYPIRGWGTPYDDHNIVAKLTTQQFKRITIKPMELLLIQKIAGQVS
jgi:hypothetical protein